MIVHNNVPAIVATRMQGAVRVTCTLVDMFDAPDIESQAKYFSIIDAADKRGGCFFAAAGDEARLDMIERQRLQEDGEPESIFESKAR